MSDSTPTTAARSLGAMELLAPAGSWSAMEAALDAGASAVYLGLTNLNARRGATNFTQEQLGPAVQKAHAHGARVYLTLNTDLSQRELGQAARMLELASQSGVDAILVRDPALLALKGHYPRVQFHFSTQTCMANSADVRAAGALGASRVVLARELSLSEIAAASCVGVETEVFIQGALCFCISGRCLLSSWAGGRSGNRGSCTSPCRVPWTVDQEPAGTPLSMRDLVTVHRLGELRDAGVTALKIEGRLKTAQWVGQAVRLYRRALSGEDPQALLKAAERLGAYAGRLFTSDYLDGKRDELTAANVGRRGGAGVRVVAASAEADPTAEPASGVGVFDLDITVTEKGIACRCQVGQRGVEWTMPRTVVRREHKAVSIAQLLASFAGAAVHGHLVGKTTTNQGQYLLVPRAANAIADRVASAVRQLGKATVEDELVRIDLPPEVRGLIENFERSPANQRALGDRPDRVRLHARSVAAFIKRLRAAGSPDLLPDAIIVEGLGADAVQKTLGHCAGIPVIAALPPVLFECDLAPMRDLVTACACSNLTVEVNTWGGWHLCKQLAVRMEGGPGMGVLNALAGRMLVDAGIGCVTLCVEADRQQLEDLSANCPVPCSLVVYGRPPLLITRAQLPREHLARLFVDRRNVKIVPRSERGLWVFRPLDPFDLRQVHNPRIRAAHLVMDLVSADDPAAEWLDRSPSRVIRTPFRFNYSRSLV